MIPTSFMSLCFYGDIKGLKRYMNSFDGERLTHNDLERALIVSAGRDHSAIVSYLVEEHDVDPSARGDEALVRAVNNGNQLMVKILLENGADPSARDYLPVALAVKRGHRALTDLFRDELDESKEHVIRSLESRYG